MKINASKDMGYWCITLITWLSLPALIWCIETDWMPLKMKPEFTIGSRVMNTQRARKAPPYLNTCSLYKATMDQHTFQQYIQYKHHIPDLKEFTLCLWFNLYNHSTDHPLFSYSLPHKPRAIYSWISNTVKKSYYMLAINDHTIYRINYPMKLHKWYHTCQSWNGKTGEWQLWVNNERAARGYYNLMVGKPIKSGGVAITGQEQSDFGGFGLKGGGLQGEITLLQLYKAALSKGKAYSDHKHHHVHNFHHDGDFDDDEDEQSSPAPEFPKELTTEHPFLENGQLKHRLPVHELLAKGTPKYGHEFDLLNYEHPTALVKIEEPIFEGVFRNKLFKRMDDKTEDISSVPRMKRTIVNMTEEKNHNPKWEMDASETKHIADSMLRRYFFEKQANKLKQHKRRLHLSEALPSSFDILADSDLGKFLPESDEYSFFKNTILDNEEGTKKEYEPAEWEVREISEVCSGCAEDPFQKANVLSWQETPKKLFAGAQYVAAIPKCHVF